LTSLSLFGDYASFVMKPGMREPVSGSFVGKEHRVLQGVLTDTDLM